MEKTSDDKTHFEITLNCVDDFRVQTSEILRIVDVYSNW